MAERKNSRKAADQAQVGRDSHGRFTSLNRNDSRPMKKAGSRRVSEDIEEEELNEE